jgi:hypothetical protein
MSPKKCESHFISYEQCEFKFIPAESDPVLADGRLPNSSHQISWKMLLGARHVAFVPENIIYGMNEKFKNLKEGLSLFVRAN